MTYGNVNAILECPPFVTYSSNIRPVPNGINIFVTAYQTTSIFR